MDLKDWGVITAMLFAYGGLCVVIIDARIARAIKTFEGSVVEPMREQLRRIEIDTVKVSTWLEVNKARLASKNLADHNSPYEINVVTLAEMIERSGYVSDPVMLAEFRRLVNDPMLPDDDAALWSIIEARFGMQALAQECARFGADGGDAPAIWILCIRRAQRVGVDTLLREIKVIK